MSKRRLETIHRQTRLSKAEKSKRRKEAQKAAEKDKKTKEAVQSAASTGITVASGVAAASAAGGGAASASAFVGGLAVAAPPFSTAAAVVVGVGVVAGLGIKGMGEKREKWLAKDGKLLNELISKYKKKKKSWRKKEMAKLLKKYDKHLDAGNKKTLALFDGNKKRKTEINWRAEKSKLEMKMRALYAAEYESDKLKARSRSKVPGLSMRDKFISKKRGKAEKVVVARLKRKQSQSIDPRTSSLKLIRPGIIQMNAQQASADLIQMQVPDTTVMKLAKLSNENPALLNKVDNISESIQNSERQVASLPMVSIPSQKDKTPILIGLASAGLGLTVLTIGLLKKRSAE